MSKTSRRKFTPEFKSKGCLDAIKEKQTIEALSKKHDFYPKYIHTRKTAFLDKAHSVFDKANSATVDESDKEQLTRLLYVHCNYHVIWIANPKLSKGAD